MDVNQNIDLIVKIFGDQMPFNRLLGLTRDSFNAEKSCITFPWKDDWMGNLKYKTLHGGLISAMLDTAGGFAVLVHFAQTPTLLERIKKAKIGTIDLRIDYLQPGRGNYFVASGQILRVGGKVAFVRTELRNDEEQLIAIGTGNWAIG